MLMGLFLLVADAANGQQNPEGNNSARAKPGERASTWTEDRRRQATPMPLPQIDAERLKKPNGQRTQSPAGAIEENSGEAEVPDDQRHGNPSKFPLAWAGKLFFTTPQGNMECSAQFIRPTVLLTAAHCVQDQATGVYYWNFAFFLQYHGGNYKNAYDWDCVATKNGWVMGDYRWDYAMINVKGRSSTGFMGWKSGWRGYGDAVIIGYPGDIAGGQRIQWETGPLKVDYENGLVQVYKRDPNFGPGSSGGAWIGNYVQRPRANYVLSVMSFGIVGQPEYAYGPFWDANFEDLLHYTERGCR
jgi:V8-like Glu-specific endopeptidase